MCIPDNVRIIIPCPVKDSCSFLDTASSVFSSTLPYHREPKYPRMEKPKDTRGEKSLVRRGDVRACVNTQAEMEGREEIGGRAH